VIVQARPHLTLPCGNELDRSMPSEGRGHLLPPESRVVRFGRPVVECTFILIATAQVPPSWTRAARGSVHERGSNA
jgi:hypothetical protein